MKTVLKITFLLAGFAAAELPLKVRADQALSQLQANIQANNFAGALPWLEKAVALESEGYKLPSGMGFFAGQVYAKNGENRKAVPYLEAYVNQPTPGKNFWEAVKLLCKASPSRAKSYLESYLAKENPPYYQQALTLYTQIEPLAKADAERISQEEALEVRLAPYRGTMTDSRDGKLYKTIRIGSQVWMAENLNYSTGNFWCFDNNAGNCFKQGRLYDWKTARNACPGGWHLPSIVEWEALSAFPASDLRTLSWNGTNSTGFNMFPVGNRVADGRFLNTHVAQFWSSDEDKSNNVRIVSHFDSDEHLRPWAFGQDKLDGLTVRCLKD